MKLKPWLCMAFICSAFQGSALAEPGVYQQLACRDNDPFVFCTQGCKNQDKNWTPIDPISATWVAVPGYCPYPTTGACCFGYVCFQSWTQTAVTALGQYMSICPAAKRQGDWKGSGRPESTPYDH